MASLIAEEEGRTDLGGLQGAPAVITVHFTVLLFDLLIRLDHGLLESGDLVPQKASHGALSGKWSPCFAGDFKCRAALSRIQNNSMRRLFHNKLTDIILLFYLKVLHAECR